MIAIAIDGGTATGKSSVAKALAKKLGFRVLDTGAIFRGIACAFVDSGKTELNEEVIKEFVKNLKVKVEFVDDLQHVFVNDIDKTVNLRTEKTSQMASKISVYPLIREFMNDVARDFAKSNNCVVEGRDICTVVLPNADVKFFFKADDKIRAERRVKQLLESGKEANFDDVYRDLVERDNRDSSRNVAPLKPAKDSIIIDSTLINENECIELCLKHIYKKINLKI